MSDGPCEELYTQISDLREEIAHLRQRLEWVAAAFHGDPLYGPAWEDQLFVDVMQLRNQHDRFQLILEKIHEAANLNGFQADRLGAVLQVLNDYHVQALPSFEEWKAKHPEKS